MFGLTKLYEFKKCFQGLKIFGLLLFVMKLGAAEYSIPPFQLAFTQPGQWIAIPSKVRGTLCQYVAENTNGFASNLVVTAMEFTSQEAEQLEAKLLDGNIKQQQRSFPMYKVLERDELAVGSYQAKLLMASYAMGQLDVIAYQVFVMQLDQARVYNFTFTCLLSEFEGLRPMFEDVVGSIRIEVMGEEKGTKAQRDKGTE